MLKKILAGAGTTMVAVVMVASPALAHFCSNSKWSETAQEKVINSNNWFTFRQLAGEFFCPAGLAYFISAAETAGLPIDRPIHGHSVMGQGALFHKGKAPEGHVYLTEAQGAILEEIVEDASALC